ncbi:MAG: peptidyl-prolyl cis-trans isomerase [Nitrospinae bacterium]|nr:peptidyl-prolyl cis-trans isomerase [Nitrospinota bacterium]
MKREKKFKILGIALLLITIPAILMSCSGGDKNEADREVTEEKKVVAIVNGENIYVDDLEIYISQQKSPVAPYIKYGQNNSRMIIREALERMIEEKLVIQEAARLNVIVTNAEIEEAVNENIAKYESGDLRAALRSVNLTLEQFRNRIAYDLLVRKVSSTIIEKMVQVSEKDVLAYYKKNSGEFDEPLKVRVLHILVNEEEKAKKILLHLKKGGDFEVIAKKESTAPEKDSGGDLGFFEEGIMPEAFDKVIFSMKVGDISHVVKTDYGYHIFKLIDKKGPKKTDKAEALSTIRMNLFDQKRDKAFNIWKQELLNKAEIKIVDTFIH